MAPAIKELSRWLDANSEYYVAPDWADVVKHSVSMMNTDGHRFLSINPLIILKFYPPVAGFPP